MNALITARLSKLPRWIRLHFGPANSIYQMLQSRVGFTGGEKAEADKRARHPPLGLARGAHVSYGVVTATWCPQMGEDCVCPSFRGNYWKSSYTFHTLAR